MLLFECQAKKQNHPKFQEEILKTPHELKEALFPGLIDLLNLAVENFGPSETTVLRGRDPASYSQTHRQTRSN